MIISIASFLFVPTYLRIDHNPVVNLAGDEPGLLNNTASALIPYLISQGFKNVIVNKLIIPGNEPLPSNETLFTSPEGLLSFYKTVFETAQFYNNNIFFRTESVDTLHAAISALQQVEADFKRHSPGLFSLAADKQLLEKELSSLNRKYLLTETEMNNQKQYVDILRSDHSSRKLQDYYNNEYEILPLWYKRFGHLLKVVTGKRSFKSLFRNDVKKYKD